MSTFWEIVLSNAVVAGLMAVAASLIDRLWKNPAAVHVLWLAVLVKLFTPPLETLHWPVAPASVQPKPRVVAPAPRIGPPGNPFGPSALDGPTRSVLSRPVGSVPRAAPFPAVAREWHPATVLAGLWFLGSACLAVGYARRIGRFVKLMRGFVAASEETRSLVSSLSVRLGLGRVPEALTTSHTLPPLVWSMGGRPRLVLPSRLFDGLSSEARASILLHELAHVRRRDHLVRLLELAATTAFWWHPAVWWARQRLRDLEEACCDAIVLEAAPRQARTYALALLETLDFLSRTPRVGVPLPTAVDSTVSLKRRIRMLAQTRPAKLRLSSAALVAGLVALPLAVAFSAEPQAQDAPPKTRPAVIVGEVKNKAGEPLADALVRAVHPAVNLRYEAPTTSSKLYETKTDAGGKYRLEVPGLDAPSSVGLDVLKPGYRRSSGAPMGFGEDDRKVEVAPGVEASSSFVLEPSLYFKGVAVDDAGEPVAGATVDAYLNFLAGEGWAKGWAEHATTDDDGAFELFNYPVDPSIVLGGRGRAEVGFKHPEHVDVYISDLFRMPENQRQSIRVVMPNGKVLSGTVLDAAGGPVAGVVVKADSRAWDAQHTTRKATTTDSGGRFVLKGMAKAKNRIRVLSTALGQKATVEKTVENDEGGFAIHLKPMDDLPTDFKTHDVLGMKLTDATPEFSLAYEFPQYTGALIIDPGEDSERLHVGRLQKGYVFWMVGQKSISSVREFVERLIAEAELQENANRGVRVVFTPVGADVDGTNTQYLKLTKADVDQLKAALKTLE